jgi:hypothetical protein
LEALEVLLRVLPLIQTPYFFYSLFSVKPNDQPRDWLRESENDTRHNDETFGKVDESGYNVAET